MLELGMRPKSSSSTCRATCHSPSVESCLRFSNVIVRVRFGDAFDDVYALLTSAGRVKRSSCTYEDELERGDRQHECQNDLDLRVEVAHRQSIRTPRQNRDR